MRIVSHIILLLFSVSSLYAQEISSTTSLNVEPRRSFTLPCSSAEEAAGDKAGAMRYAIQLGEWQQQETPQGVTFTSSFEAPFSWIGRQSFISIESATAPYSVWVGEKKVGSNFTPSIAAQFDVTRYLERETQMPILITMHHDNSILQLESWNSADKELKLGSVTMLSQPTMYVRDVKVKTSLQSGVLSAAVDIIVKSEALNARTSRISYELLTPQGHVAHRGNADVDLDMRREDTIHLFAIIPDSLAWSADNPKLYRLNVSTQYRGRYIEYHSYEIGMRSIEVSGEGQLLVNGVAQSLKAKKIDNNSKIEQLEKLKAEGYNTIKIAAGGYNRELYNYADSAGLYIISTAPVDTRKSGNNIQVGGNPTNDPTRTEQYIERVDALYNIAKNHPSVVAFSLADSSLNGINLYESYLYLKRLESQRPIIYTDSNEWNSDKLSLDF